MEPHSVASSFLKFVKLAWANHLRPWLSARIRTILVCTIVGIVAYLSYAEYQRRNSYQIDFYIGNSGGRNSETAWKIHEELETSKSLFGKSVQLDTHYTDGFKENFEVVREDIKGNRIAFAYDGMHALRGVGESDNVQTLIPMQWSHLHILVRKGFFQELQALRSDSHPRSQETDDDETVLQSFSVFAKRVNDRIEEVDAAFASSQQQSSRHSYPRFYLGDSHSAVRELAAVILRRCGIDPDVVQAPDHGEISDLPAKFRRKEVDVAFYLCLLYTSDAADE